MGFPGSTIDELQLVSDDASDKNSADEAESEDEDEESNSKYFSFYFCKTIGKEKPLISIVSA